MGIITSVLTTYFVVKFIFLNGLKAPDLDVAKIEVSDLYGNSYKINDFRGKTVFVNIWATWCKPCIEEMPLIDNAYQKLSKEDFVFLLISDEEIDKIKKFDSTTDYSFKLYKSKISFNVLDINTFPLSYIIDKEGKVVYSKLGMLTMDVEKFVDLLYKHHNN